MIASKLLNFIPKQGSRCFSPPVRLSFNRVEGQILEWFRCAEVKISQATYKDQIPFQHIMNEVVAPLFFVHPTSLASECALCDPKIIRRYCAAAIPK
jgi:hypothetical protein